MKIILASKSEVRKKILDENNFSSIVVPSNVDEDQEIIEASDHILKSVSKRSDILSTDIKDIEKKKRDQCI